MSSTTCQAQWVSTQGLDPWSSLTLLTPCSLLATCHVRADHSAVRATYPPFADSSTVRAPVWEAVAVTGVVLQILWGCLAALAAANVYYA